MPKIPLGNGKHCYTQNCSLHAALWQLQKASLTPETHPSQWASGMAAAAVYIPRLERPEYMAAIDEKHFKAEGHGSKFTDPRVSQAEHVLALAAAQRGDLNGDDRMLLKKLGAPDKAFIDSCRYLCVKVGGVEALISTSELPEGQLLTVKGKGSGADGRPKSLSIVAAVKQLKPVDYATVIIGPKEDAEGNAVDGEMLWTMFPGVATQSPRSDKLREAGLEEGSQLTVAQLRKLFGDFKINTELQA